MSSLPPLPATPTPQQPLSQPSTTTTTTTTTTTYATPTSRHVGPRYYVIPTPSPRSRSRSRSQSQSQSQPQPQPHSTASCNGRVEGSINYSPHDTDLLLDLVDRIKPVGAMMWTRVCEEFNSYPGIEVTRTLKSLKDKFKNLRLMKYSTGDPQMPSTVRRAKLIYKDIQNHHKINMVGDPSQSDSQEYAPISDAESLLCLDPLQSIRHELFTGDSTQSNPSNSPTTPSSSPSTSTPQTQPQPQSTPQTHKSSYTFTQRKKRSLEDAVMSIADSCKRQQTHDDLSSPMMGMLVQLMQMQQQQQQAQQQFFMEVMSKLQSNNK